MARASSSRSGQKAKPTLDKPHAHTCPHSLRPGHCAHASPPTLHNFGKWEETKVPWRKPAQTRGKCANATQTMAPAKIDYFSHPHYKETPLNEMKSFLDLLHLPLLVAVYKPWLGALSSTCKAHYSKLTSISPLPCPLTLPSCLLHVKAVVITVYLAHLGNTGHSQDP